MRPPAPPVAGWSVSGKALPPAPPRREAPRDVPTAAPQFRGLSVAEAARASTIVFRPLRRQAAGARAAPSVVLRSKPAPVPAARRPLPVAVPNAAVERPAPKAVTAPPAVPALRDRGEPTPRQRFAKTIAELQRYQAASREREPGSDVVPRPTLPLEDESSGGWFRLWSRRKTSDAP